MSAARHRELLEAFYRRGAEAPVAPAQRLRFELESDRRILDVCRILWRNWPLAAMHGRAWRGDEMSLGTAARIADVCRHGKDIEEGVRLAFEQWIATVDDPVLDGLRRYDDARCGRERGAHEPDELARALLAGIVPADFRLLALSFDPVSYGRTLEYYARLHAPDALVRSIAPPGEPVVLAFYVRQGRVFAAHVGALLAQEEGA